jgi:hypothetical protein
MPPRISARTVVNRKALDAIRAGAVDGMERWATAFIETNRPNVPDEPPYGAGLVDTGAFGIWADGKKVAGLAQKPRAAKVPKQGIQLVVGYDFPGHFAEGGTINETARPFVTPHAMEHLPSLPEAIQVATAPRLRGG